MHRTEISVLNTETKKNLKKKINYIEMTVNNRSGNKKVCITVYSHNKETVIQ